MLDMPHMPGTPRTLDMPHMLGTPQMPDMPPLLGKPAPREVPKCMVQEWLRLVILWELGLVRIWVMVGRVMRSDKALPRHLLVRMEEVRCLEDKVLRLLRVRVSDLLMLTGRVLQDKAYILIPVRLARDTSVPAPVKEPLVLGTRQRLLSQARPRRLRELHLALPTPPISSARVGIFSVDPARIYRMRRTSVLLLKPR